MIKKHTALFVVIALITLYSVAGSGYYREGLAFLPNGSTTLNQSDDISNDSSINNSSLLKVIVSVKNTGGGSAKPADFYVEVLTNGGAHASKEAHPDTFYGSDKGAISAIIPGTYVIRVTDMINNVLYSIEFSGDCVSKGLNTAEVALNPGDKRTCTITSTPANF